MKIAEITDEQLNQKRDEMLCAAHNKDTQKLLDVVCEIMQEYVNRLANDLICTALDAPAAIAAASMYIDGLEKLYPGSKKAANSLIKGTDVSTMVIDDAELKKQMEEQ